MRAPMNNVVLVQIFDAFQDLFRVVAEDFLFESSKPRQNVGYWTSWNELHKDADDVVFQASTKIPGQINSAYLLLPLYGGYVFIGVS